MQRAITIHWPDVNGAMIGIRCEDGQITRLAIAGEPVSDWQERGDVVVLRSEHHEVHLPRWMYHVQLGIDPTPAREQPSMQRAIDAWTFRC